MHEQINIADSASIINLIPYSKATCFIIKSLFNDKFCDELISNAINLGFLQANDKYPNSYRNNDRIVEDNQVLAKKLYEHCKAFIPKSLIVDNKILKPCALNDRLRTCRYASGQSFSIHRDGVYYPEKCAHKSQQSILTFLLYLNGTEEFKGGETAFYNDQYGNKKIASYLPQRGDVAIFDHKIWHSGEEVSHGIKYILRSDIIYYNKDTRKIDSEQKKPKQHDGYIWKILNLGNNRYATASRDKSIKIWNSKLKCQQILKKHQNSVFDLATDSKNDLISVSRDGHMSKWYLSSTGYQFKSKVNTGHSCALSVITLPNDSVITCGADGLIKLWNKNLEQIKIYSGHSGWVWKCLTYKENSFISCGSDGTIRLWDLFTAAPIHVIQLSHAPLRCMDFDNQYLYVGDENGTIFKIAAPNLKIVNSWNTHHGIIRDIAITKDFVYSAGEDNNITKTDHLGRGKSIVFQHQDFATSVITVGSKGILSSSYSGLIQFTK